MSLVEKICTFFCHFLVLVPYFCSPFINLTYLIPFPGVSTSDTVLGSLSTPTKRPFESGMSQDYKYPKLLCFFFKFFIIAFYKAKIEENIHHWDFLSIGRVLEYS